MEVKDEKYTNELQDINFSDKTYSSEKEKTKINPIIITVCITVGLCVIMFNGLLCYRLSKTDLSIENILSTLLAFFSIFISIFFFFKADETSKGFYIKSYDIMKEVTLVLGRIEERFGGKLDNLYDKISHLESVSDENAEKIKKQTSDKDSIINELMDKAKLNEKEKQDYMKKLEENEKQIEELITQKYDVERQVRELRGKIRNSVGSVNSWEPNDRVLRRLLLYGENIFSPDIIKVLIDKGYLDRKGNINRSRILEELEGKHD